MSLLSNQQRDAIRLAMEFSTLVYTGGQDTAEAFFRQLNTESRAALVSGLVGIQSALLTNLEVETEIHHMDILQRMALMFERDAYEP